MQICKMPQGLEKNWISGFNKHVLSIKHHYSYFHGLFVTMLLKNVLNKMVEKLLSGALHYITLVVVSFTI